MPPVTYRLSWYCLPGWHFKKANSPGSISTDPNDIQIYWHL